MSEHSSSKQLSQAALARALGLSPAAITKFKARGMPIDSVEAAQAWRAKHLRPRVRADRQKPAGSALASPLQRAEQLGLLALEDFEAHAGALRAALRALSREDARRVRLEFTVWDQLHGAELLAEVCDPTLAGRVDVDEEASDVLSFEAATDILFDVACGRRRYTGGKP